MYFRGIFTQVSLLQSSDRNGHAYADNPSLSRTRNIWYCGSNRPHPRTFSLIYYIHVRIYVCIYLLTRVHMQKHCIMHACDISICANTREFFLYLCTHMHGSICVCMYVPIHVDMDMYLYMQVLLAFCCRITLPESRFSDSFFPVGGSARMDAIAWFLYPHPPLPLSPYRVPIFRIYVLNEYFDFFIWNDCAFYRVLYLHNIRLFLAAAILLVFACLCVLLGTGSWNSKFKHFLI